MIHIDASVSLLGYKAWRESLAPLEVGIIVEWVKPYSAFTVYDSISAGQRFLIKRVKGPSFGTSKLDADKVYEMVLVSKTGKEFKKKTCWSVENLARRIHLAEITIIN